MKVFYCAFESIFDPVFDSQVVTFLEKINARIKREEHKVRLIVFNSIGNVFKRKYLKKRKEIKKRLKGKCFFSVKVPYMYNFPYLFRISLFFNSLLAAVVFMWLNGIGKNRAVIHCRTEIGSFILLSIKNFFKLDIKVICDCRGIGSKEILYRLNGKRGLYASKKIEKVERFARRESDYIFCVSNSFKRYIIENNSVNLNKIKVVPCCIDGERFAFDPGIRKSVRTELGLKGMFVVIYAGSMNKWQLPGEMVNIFKIFKKKIRNSVFLILTCDYSFTLSFMKKSGLRDNDYIIESKSPDQVPMYLQAGDLALLIREANEVNKVAFPVKFSEYVRSGIPVLSSITSDVRDLIKENDLGFVIDSYKEVRGIEMLADKVRGDLDYMTSDRYKKMMSNTLGEKLTWDNYIDSIIRVYKKEFNLAAE